MKPACFALAGAIAIAGCGFAVPPATANLPAQSAWLIASDGHCLSAIAAAATRLTGRQVTLAADAFMASDSVVLSSIGQMADGRMTRPPQVLQLQLVAQRCELRLQGQPDAVVLEGCRCRAAPAR